MSRRDNETVRASMAHAEHAIARTLLTVADYAALPGVRGVEQGPGQVTLYCDPDMPDSARAHLRADVEQRRPLTLLVVWKTDRRRPRQSPLPSIPGGTPLSLVAAGHQGECHWPASSHIRRDLA